MASITQKGSFKHIEAFLDHMKNRRQFSKLEKYAKLGVDALAKSTPIDSGLTANSWHAEISVGNGSASITWNNTNVNNGVNVAIILDVGHGTGTGGYVQGRNYISPAIQPIFDKIADGVWKEVTDA